MMDGAARRHEETSATRLADANSGTRRVEEGQPNPPCAELTKGTMPGDRRNGVETQYNHFPVIEDDPILGLRLKYDAKSNLPVISDPRAELGTCRFLGAVGEIVDESGATYTPPAVRKMMARHMPETQNHGYQTGLGYEPFCRLAAEHLLGEEIIDGVGSRLISAQVLGGTGGLHDSIQLHRKAFPDSAVAFSEFSWPAYMVINGETSVKNAILYRYYDPISGQIDMKGLKEDMRKLPPNTLFSVQVCGHNGTGADPTRAQFDEIAGLAAELALPVQLDIAYHTLVRGHAEDTYAIHAFLKAGVNLFIVDSFSKKFGTYDLRVGALHVILRSEQQAQSAKKLLVNRVFRGVRSNHVADSAKIVAGVMESQELSAELAADQDRVRAQLNSRRQLAVDRLNALGNHNHDHLRQGGGMFGLLNLGAGAQQYMMENHGVFLPKVMYKGLELVRASFPGLDPNRSLDYWARSVVETEKALKVRAT